jgi:ribosomal protein L7/L12
MKATVNLTKEEALKALAEHFHMVFETSIDQDSIHVVVEGLNDSPELERKEIADKCIELLKFDKKINAIKEFRAFTGFGLKESKEVMDDYLTRLPQWIETGKL